LAGVSSQGKLELAYQKLLIRVEQHDHAGAELTPAVRRHKVLHMITPSTYTEFGVKGLGEGGAVGIPAAIVSAVNDAVRPFQIEIHDLRSTPQRIVATIESAKQKAVRRD
jgi:carbon-monoxide dehydrogenase large subunit